MGAAPSPDENGKGDSPMGKSQQQKADEFVRNAEKGDHAANDDLVRDEDPRDPFIIDGN